MRLLAVLMVAISLAPAAASSQAQAGTEAMYIAAGDSITAGVGSSLPRTRSYPALVQHWMSDHGDAPVLLENLAVPGETAESFVEGEQLDALRQAVARARSTELPILAVTVTLGGNELLAVRDSSNEERQASLTAFASSLPAALDDIRGAVGDDVPVIVATIYDPTGTAPDVEFTEGWWIARFNEVIRNAAEEASATVADVAGESGDWAGTLSRYPSDVHPTNAGHFVLARTFWAALGLDEVAPEIVVMSGSETSRATPTLRFSVSEAIDVAYLTLTVEDGFAYPPVLVGDNEYVALLDAGSATSVTVEIVAVDLAGNGTSLEHAISINRPAP